MMEKCKHYTLDCEEEEKGCKGCAYYKKPAAKKDVTYCMNEKCATKDECARYYEHYKFDNIRNYSFQMKCDEYQGEDLYDI